MVAAKFLTQGQISHDAGGPQYAACICIAAAMAAPSDVELETALLEGIRDADLQGCSEAEPDGLVRAVRRTDVASETRLLIRAALSTYARGSPRASSRPMPFSTATCAPSRMKMRPMSWGQSLQSRATRHRHRSMAMRQGASLITCLRSVMMKTPPDKSLCLEFSGDVPY